MAAIITEDFRRHNARMLLDDLASTNYYMGISQQETWPESFTLGQEIIGAPYPKGTYGEVRRAFDGLTGLFRTTVSSLMIPKITIDAGSTYKVYDPFDPTCFYSDTQLNVLPCYGTIDPNLIFLCIHKASDSATMTDQDIVDNLGANGLSDYGTVVVGDYTWAYIGRYDNFSLINNSQFISIAPEFTLSPNTDLETYAQANVAPPGIHNNFIITAKAPGNAGNLLGISLTENLDSPPSGAQIQITEIPGPSTVYDFEYHPGTTAQELIDFINLIGNWPGNDQKFTAEASGNVTGALTNVNTLLLTGGDQSSTYIKQKTGGLLFGFTVVYGGDDYYVDGVAEDEINPIKSTTSTANLYGLDALGQPINGNQPIPLTVDVLYNSVTKKITSVSLQDAPVIGNQILGLSKARLELTNWTLLNGKSDPSSEVHIIPHIAPIEGFGYDKVETLPGWYVGTYSDTGFANFTPDLTTYHQISLIRDPRKLNGDPIIAESVQPLPYFELGEAGNDFPVDPQLYQGWQIWQGTNKVGVLSHVQLVSGNADQTALDPVRYYYYHDYHHGFEPIITDDPVNGYVAETIKFVSPDGQTEVDTLISPFNVVPSPDYLPGSGALVFEDNRSTVTRSEGQNEELKLIIQL